MHEQQVAGEAAGRRAGDIGEGSVVGEKGRGSSSEEFHVSNMHILSGINQNSGAALD